MREKESGNEKKERQRGRWKRMRRAPYRHSIPLGLYCFLVWPGGPRRSTHTVWFYLWLPKLQVAARRGRGDVTHRVRENNSRSIPTTVRGTDEMRDTPSSLASRSHGIPTRTTGQPIRCATDDRERVFGDDRRDLLLVRLPRCIRRTKSRSR